ncbi:MAG: hypothetical protein CR997_10260 [Acidobacteria bacterium]|nr:MAG: hypothetical protein CR997_10260 [Acidobacteriota bacterium]
MMWRVLAALDFVTIAECHFGVLVPAFGISTGTHCALGCGTWKFDKKCFLGPISINTPPTLTHDAGMGRPHVLIDLSPVPPPPAPPATPANSALTSALATACSAMKPTFSSSRDLRNGKPVSTEVLPFCSGLVLSGNVPCGLGGPHSGIPMIPTQQQDWSGLTFGDIVGGFVNMQAETLSQAALEGFCKILPWKFGEIFAGTLALGSQFDISIWPSGDKDSVPIQQAIDRATGQAPGAPSGKASTSSSAANASSSATASPSSSASGSSSASSSGSSGSSGASSSGSSAGSASGSGSGSGSTLPGLGYSPYGQVV